MKERFYHYSPYNFKPGDVLIPWVNKKNYLNSGTVVYFTNSKYVHFTIVKEAVKGNWTCYEIQRPDKFYCGLWDDLFTKETVKIIRKIGSCKGICKKLRLKKSERIKLENLHEELRSQTTDEGKFYIESEILKVLYRTSCVTYGDRRKLQIRGW